MATKTKDSGSVVGKEKKAPSSSSPITSTKRATKLCITSSTVKATPSPSEKQVPNYLKPTISSRIESHSFKLSRSSDAPNRPTLDRRRSFDNYKPPSPSRLLKQKQPSPSRLHKALVSPGPRDRSLHRSTTLPVKSTNPSKPISDRISKTPREEKTQPLTTKNAKKSSIRPRLSPSTTKKVADNASADSKNATKSTTAETTEAINVETEPEVKEATNEENINGVGEVETVEKQEHEVENIVSDIPPHVDSEPEQNHEHDQNLGESDQPHIQGDNEKVIPTVSEEEEAKQEQIKNEHDQEDENTNIEESNINESSDHQEIEHSTTEGEVDEVKEKEEEGRLVKEEDHKNETNNEEEKEGVEEGTSEGVKLIEEQEEHEHVEGEAEEAKPESTKPKQQEGGVLQGKKEAQVSNDMIEETAGKLLEARNNKVRALAGAFQSVIDYQTK